MAHAILTFLEKISQSDSIDGIWYDIHEINETDI